MCLRNNPWHWSVQEPNFCVITLLNVTVGAAVLGQFTVIESRLTSPRQVRGHGSKPQTPILGDFTWSRGWTRFCSSFQGCDTGPLFGQPLLLPSYHWCHLMWTVNKDRRQPWVVMDWPTCSLFTLVVVVMKGAVNIVFLLNHNLGLLKELGWQPKISAYFTCRCQRSPGAEKQTLFVSCMSLLCGGHNNPVWWRGQPGTASPQHPISFSSLWSSPSLPMSLISLQRAGSIKPVGPRSKPDIDPRPLAPPHASDGIPLLSPPWITHSYSLPFTLLRKNRMLMSTTHQLSNLHEPEHPWKGSATE